MHPFYKKKHEIDKEIIRLEENIKRDISEITESNLMDLLPLESMAQKIPMLSRFFESKIQPEESNDLPLIVEIASNISNLYTNIQQLIDNHSDEQ